MTQDLKLLKLPKVLNTSDGEIIKEFFVPALSNSIRYDRGVGYFSASWLRLAIEGMIKFAENGGKARWITSPILSETDWAAMVAGISARYDNQLFDILDKKIDDLKNSLSKDTLSAFAWMIADDILDFKLALPRNKLHGGEFHDKFGIFIDQYSNIVSFNGSYNESVQGTRNYESIKIFTSWNEAYTPLVQDDLSRFERIWNNFDPNVQVFDIPSALKAKIIQLRSTERPYEEPDPDLVQKLQIADLISRAKFLGLSIPPEIQLRPYQIMAIESWFSSNCQGFLEMATGAGKTITSLAAMTHLFERLNRRLAIIITVPYQHLVDQWLDTAKMFGLQPILAYQSKSRWSNKLHQHIIEFNREDRDIVAVITTHTTFASEEFQDLITRLNGSSLLIADEVHHLGAARSRTKLPENIGNRLALSATPDRWMDEAGTRALRDYFGQTVFEFNLDDAIKNNILTPYRYFPQLVELTEDELTLYVKLSADIARLMNNDEDEASEALKMLLIKRARLLNNAQNKLQVLEKLVDALDDPHHILFYCSPEQIESVSRILGWNLGLLIARFTAQEPNKERKQILDNFASGNLQGLVAMKCLDEGVDVPSTQTAFILASSSNPREFIQRRGRILRRAEGKSEATIFDLIAIPPLGWTTNSNVNAEKSIIQHELKRFMEFAGSAINKHQALDVIWEVARIYGIQL